MRLLLAVVYSCAVRRGAMWACGVWHVAWLTRVARVAKSDGCVGVRASSGRARVLGETPAARGVRRTGFCFRLLADGARLAARVRPLRAVEVS